MVRLSALCTGCLSPPPPPGNISGTHFCYRLSQLQGYSAAGRIISMENTNDSIGNRTRDLTACSAVPQRTAPPAACPRFRLYHLQIITPRSENIRESLTSSEYDSHTCYGFCHVHKCCWTPPPLPPRAGRPFAVRC
jgi:hypothetical protein